MMVLFPEKTFYLYEYANNFLSLGKFLLQLNMENLKSRYSRHEIPHTSAIEKSLPTKFLFPRSPDIYSSHL